MRQWISAGRRCALVIILVGSTAAPAAASDFFPLEPGAHWEYIQTYAPVPTLFVDVVGPADFFGRSTVAVTRTVSGYGDSTTSTLYYSEGPGGQILYHGARLVSSLGGLVEGVLTPPQPIIQFPLTDGASWSGSYSEATYQDGELLYSVEVAYTAAVTWEDHLLSVPAGDFTSTKITITTSNGDESYWYSEGVGMVRWERGPTSTPASTYNLFGHNLAVPTSVESMSGLKSHFVND